MIAKAIEEGRAAEVEISEVEISEIGLAKFGREWRAAEADYRLLLRALRRRSWLHLHAPRVEAGDELPIDEKLAAWVLRFVNRRFVNLGPGLIENLAAWVRLCLGAHHGAPVGGGGAQGRPRRRLGRGARRLGRGARRLGLGRHKR